MKKYVKPELIYERYELSQHIADCGWELNDDYQVCTADPDPNMGLSGGTLFNIALNCVYKVDNGYEAYCYQNGSGSPFALLKS